MRLLILTQKVDINDENLGFFHRWLEEFAKHCESLTVICLQRGEYRLPANVKVLSLGKEIKQSRIRYLLNFFKYILSERRHYDTVFVHMNKEYVLLGGWLWKILGKKITLWYAHGRTDLFLRAAEKIVNIIFTSTRSGCRLDSDKIKIVGQGIDVNVFASSDRQGSKHGIFKIVSVGRISPVKDYQTLIEAIEILTADGISLDVSIVGGPILSNEVSYQSFLKKMVAEKRLNNVIHFLGGKSNRGILPFLQCSDLFVNMSHTGSLDKAVLEAMAVGLPILTCNEALEMVLGSYNDILMYPKGDYAVLAKKIKMIVELSSDQRREISRNLRDIVIKNHSLGNFIKKIIEIVK